MQDPPALQILNGILILRDRLLEHWSSMGLADFLAVVFALFLVVLARGGNNLFIGFLSSKPEGRKTVIGKGNRPLTEVG